jgi:arylsulfatase A-like enzyme
MNRIPKTLLLAFLFGASVGALDSAYLMWKEAGVRLLNPAIEIVQVLLAYGGLAALFGLIGAFVLRKLKPETIAALAATAVAGMSAMIWVHSRILQNKPMFGAQSMMGNLSILIGAFVLIVLFRLIGRSKRAVPIALTLALIPSAYPFTRWVKIESEPKTLVNAELPNITFLLLDTQRADRLGCYGYEREDGKQVSPVIDALAAKGTRFDWCYAAAPWTRPSIASMFTGLYPTSHGAYEPTRALPDWTVTMAEVMHEKGYLTGGFSANANISAVWGFGQGFQEFWCLDDKELIDIVTWGEAVTRLRRMFKILHTTVDNAAVVNEQVYPFVARAAGQGRPVFTYVQYLDPHFPYDPVEDLINDPAPNLDDLMPDVESKDGTFLPYPFEERPLPPKHVMDGFAQLYDAEVAFMDREIGRLLDDMKAKGLYGGPNDWLIITSDHGEEFFEHEQWGHGQNLYNEVIRVPLIVLGPDVPAGQVIQTPVSLVDLLPTLTEIVDGDELIVSGIRTEDDNGKPIPLGHPGKSLIPLWTDGDEAELREIYAEKMRLPGHVSLRRGNYKIIQVENRAVQLPDEDNPGKTRPLDFYTLYDLGNDPFETQGYLDDAMIEYPVHPNVQDRFRLIPESLHKAIEDLMGRLPVQESNAQQIGFGHAFKQVTRSEIDSLFKLGYLTLEQRDEMIENLGKKAGGEDADSDDGK